MIKLKKKLLEWIQDNFRIFLTLRDKFLLLSNNLNYRNRWLLKVSKIITITTTTKILICSIPSKQMITQMFSLWQITCTCILRMEIIIVLTMEFLIFSTALIITTIQLIQIHLHSNKRISMLILTLLTISF